MVDSSVSLRNLFFAFSNESVRYQNHETTVEIVENERIINGLLFKLYVVQKRVRFIFSQKKTISFDSREDSRVRLHI